MLPRLPQTRLPSSNRLSQLRAPRMASRKACEPRTEVWAVEDRKTEVIHLGASCEPHLQLLIVPGNPGQAPYYTPFLKSLHTLCGGRASVTAVSHLGMDGLNLTSPGEVYSLEEQIQHKAAFVREHLLGEGKPPVVILAHSIGTYMSLHALHRLEQQGAAIASMVTGAAETAPEGDTARRRSSSGVVKLIGLFPFLTVNQQCSRQAMLRRLTQLHGPLSALASALHILLPMSVRRWLLAQVNPELEPHAAETAARLLHPRAVRNSLYLGRCEFQTLSAPADWEMVRALGPRFAVFCCPRDKWMPLWKWEQMLERVPGVEAHWEEQQCHAFCVSEDKSQKLAHRVVGILCGSGIASTTWGAGWDEAA